MLQLDHKQVLALLPDRDENAHKGDFGKILLLCGSKGYTGAAYLAAMGALRSGTGLVFLGVPESIYAIEAMKLNEAIVFPLPEEGGKLCAEAIPEILERYDAVTRDELQDLAQSIFSMDAASLSAVGRVNSGPEYSAWLGR